MFVWVMNTLFVVKVGYFMSCDFGIMVLVVDYNNLQKIFKNLCKLRKSCNNKRSINRIYSEKLHYNCLQQLPTLRLKT